VITDGLTIGVIVFIGDSLAIGVLIFVGNLTTSLGVSNKSEMTTRSRSSVMRSIVG